MGTGTIENGGGEWCLGSAAWNPQVVEGIPPLEGRLEAIHHTSLQPMVNLEVTRKTTR